jgi:hypothetical protein
MKQHILQTIFWALGRTPFRELGIWIKQRNRQETLSVFLFYSPPFFFPFSLRDYCSFHLPFIKHLVSPSADLTPQENAASILVKA